MFAKTWLLVALLMLREHLVSAADASVRCYTQRATTSPRGAIPTTTRLQTIKLTQRVYHTVTPTTTKIPPPKTSHTTATITSVLVINIPQITDTFTAVLTTTSTTTVDLPTQTITDTATVTESTTETVLGTATISATAGFQPVQSTLPQSSRKKRSADGVSLFARAANVNPFCGGAKWNLPKFYPASVTCLGLVKSIIVSTITVTARTTKTIIAPTPTTTITSTTSVTVTNLATTPNAATTVTSTLVIPAVTTNSPSTTTTTTTTTTNTITTISPTATVYAQCNPENFASRLNGLPINGFADRSGALGVLSTSDQTAEACCNSCAINPNCAAAAFSPGFCLLGTTSSSCTAGQYSVGATSGSGTQYTLMNGACGAFNVNSGPA